MYVERLHKVVDRRRKQHCASWVACERRSISVRRRSAVEQLSFAAASSSTGVAELWSYDTSGTERRRQRTISDDRPAEWADLWPLSVTVRKTMPRVRWVGDRRVYDCVAARRDWMPPHRSSSSSSSAACSSSSRQQVGYDRRFLICSFTATAITVAC